VNKPHRAHVVKISIEGDNWEDVISELNSILYNIQKDGPSPTRLCGGGSCSSILEYRYYPEVTPESYIRDVREWLEQRRAEEEAVPTDC